VEGRRLVLLLEDHQLSDPGVLECTNSLLAGGEVSRRAGRASTLMQCTNLSQPGGSNVEPVKCMGTPAHTQRRVAWLWWFRCPGCGHTKSCQRS
jgi:hypothetical protein